jgi:cobalt-zinc-cadmium resistance protein CzcA
MRLAGTAFSVSAAIGFVALFGIAAMEGIIILSYFNMLIDTGLERSAAITRPCDLRLRPVMMTCMAACVGLLPAALSTGIGSQVQKPLAPRRPSRRMKLNPILDRVLRVAHR